MLRVVFAAAFALLLLAALVGVSGEASAALSPGDTVCRQAKFYSGGGIDPWIVFGIARNGIHEAVAEEQTLLPQSPVADPSSASPDSGSGVTQVCVEELGICGPLTSVLDVLL